jgi:hypothetical protein
MNVTDQNGVTSYANTNYDLDAIVVIYDPNGVIHMAVAILIHLQER